MLSSCGVNARSRERRTGRGGVKPVVQPVMAGMVLLCIGVLPGFSHAQNARTGDAEQTRGRLEQLQQDIQRITSQQRERQLERDTLQGELRETELALGTLARAQRRTRDSIASNRQEITALQARQGELRGAAKAQQSLVAAELREAWKSNGNNELRLLLGETDPQLLARMLAYYRYIVGARSALLNEYRNTLEQLADTESALSVREAALDREQENLAQQQRILQESQHKRARVLAEIERALATDEANLAARQADREQLEALLEEIDAALAQLIPEDSVQDFTAARGQMPWPVKGKLTARFGSPRNQGKMRWQGVRLAAATGSAVSAIHHGRVVYADWLRGSGLLLVIDHGEGYMSLYAHNESLLREVGDWVSAGAPVATVGDSGGQGEAGLYFEIRKDGKPTDPQRWCSG